jgi:hypothetical protein
LLLKSASFFFNLLSGVSDLFALEIMETPLNNVCLCLFRIKSTLSHLICGIQLIFLMRLLASQNLRFLWTTFDFWSLNF